MAKKFFAITIITLLITSAANTQIYQWKDESGKTIYSDKPPVGHVRQQRTISSESPAAAETSQKTLSDRELEFRNAIKSPKKTR